MSRFAVDFEVANYRDVLLAEAGTLPPEQVRRARLQGVVDTGASYRVLPETIATQRGLRLAGSSSVRYADQRTATRSMVKDAQVELLGRDGTFRAIVEPDHSTALIGAIVLEDLDLLVDCRAQRLLPRDPNQIIAAIE